MDDTRGAHDFRPDYTILELDDRADWKTTRAQYRRLVHLWHPDRYAKRPRELEHAQQQFILLTKSYDNLKNFHRSYGRLPFEPSAGVAAKTEAKMANRTRERKSSRYRENRATSRDTVANDRRDRSEPCGIEAGIVSRDPGTIPPVIAANPQIRQRILWAFFAGAMIFATAAVFYVLDKKASREVIERGREVIRQAPLSDFMPTNAEIRRSEAKGAFVQPTN